jgi:toxin ParE1/3/4
LSASKSGRKEMQLNVSKRFQADRDIEECFVYIAEGNLDVAVSFLVAVETTLDELARFPLPGKARRSIDPRLEEMRVWRVRGYEKYLLFYIVTNEKLELVRVLHSSRDIESILD